MFPSLLHSQRPASSASSFPYFVFRPNSFDPPHRKHVARPTMSFTLPSDAGERLQSDSPVEHSGEVCPLLEALHVSLAATRLPEHESRLIQQLLAVLQGMDRRTRRLEQDLERYREREEDAKSRSSLLRQKEEEDIVKTAQLSKGEERFDGKEGTFPKRVATFEKRPTTKGVRTKKVDIVRPNFSN